MIRNRLIEIFNLQMYLSPENFWRIDRSEDDILQSSDIIVGFILGNNW